MLDRLVVYSTGVLELSKALLRRFERAYLQPTILW